MHIESGSTGERRTRVLIFLVMCVAFTLWFGYDGLIGYPKKNLEWARQALPERLPDLRANPRINDANLGELERMAAGRKDQASHEVTRQQVENLLGPPVFEQKKELRYVGPDLAVTVRLDEGKVFEVVQEELKPDQQPRNPNYRVRSERVARLRPGTPEKAVTEELGEPTTTQEKKLWFVGPAAYAAVEIKDGKLIGEPVIRKNTEPSEGDIFIQKAIAATIAVISVFVAINFMRVLRLRAELDDDGLRFNARQIRWDDMTGLKTDDYAAKGWVDLLYSDAGSNRTLRLDSYHLDRFQEIVDAICERKGFAAPKLPQPSDEQP
jgi:hypothetical protein